MQGRIVALFLPVFIAAVAVFGILVARESADRLSSDAALERVRFAAALQGDLPELLEPGRSELLQRRVAESATPNRVAYVTVNGESVPPSHVPADPIRRRIDAALPPDSTVWPWVDGDFVTRAAFDLEADAVGITVIDSTDPVQAAVSRRWTMIAAGVVTVMALLAAATYPLTRWALKPIGELDDAAQALAAGDLSARASVGAGAPELRQVADSFNLMAEQLAAGIHRERLFVASASHHFGNLLTPLRIRIGLLDQSDPVVGEALAELDRLEAVAERLMQLNHVVESEAPPIPMEVGAVVDDSIASWRAVTDAAGVGLVREGAEVAYAWAVPGAIEETVDNLIDNALKYGQGSDLSVRVVRGLTNIRVVVADGGPGMTEGELAHAQTQFWRGPTQQNKPGSGLGLAIVVALAARCRGQFEMRNGPDGGLESTLVLQRARPGTDEDVNDDPGPAPTPESG